MKTPLKLCYIHNIVMPGPEANTVHVAKMCSAFAANGCDVTLIAAAAAGETKFAETIRTHYGLQHPFAAEPLPGFAAKPSLAALYGAARARLAGADLVYTRAPHVALAACTIGLPVIFEIHADETAFSSLGRLALERLRTHPRLLGVVTISQALAERLRPLFPAQRLVVAHDGADAHETSAYARGTEGKLRAGYVGHLYRGRGIELIAQLAALCPWAEFDIIGGAGEDLARWQAAQTPANLRFLGAVPHAQVPAQLADFDIALAPYQRAVYSADGRTDTSRWMSPLKLFEYMAAGAAIVASDMPAVREILQHGETALLADPESPDAWAVALERLHQEPDLRAALGAAALAHFASHYTWEQRARFLLQTFALDRITEKAA